MDRPRPHLRWGVFARHLHGLQAHDPPHERSGAVAAAGQLAEHSPLPHATEVPVQALAVAHWIEQRPLVPQARSAPSQAAFASHSSEHANASGHWMTVSEQRPAPHSTRQRIDAGQSSVLPEQSVALLHAITQVSAVHEEHCGGHSEIGSGFVGFGHMP